MRKPGKMRRMAVVGGVALSLTLLAAACSSNSSSSTTTTSGSGTTTKGGPAPATIKIGMAGGFAQAFLPEYLASGLGYYAAVDKQFNTNISFDIYPGGTQAEPAFLGGTDQLMVIGTNSWISPVLQGKDQVAIFNNNVGLQIVMGGATKYKTTRASNIKAYDGGTWCQTGPVGTAHTAIQLEIGLNKMDPSKQNIVSVGSVSAYAPALSSGQADICAEDVASAATGVINGTSYNVANLADPAVAQKLAGSIIGIPLTTSHAFANQYPALTQAITDATLKAFLYIQTNLANPTLIYNHLNSDYQSGVPLGTFVQAMSLLGPAYGTKYVSGEFTQQQANDTTSLFLGTALIPASSVVNTGQVWWNKFAVQAYTDLGKTPPAGTTGPSVLASKPGPASAEAAAAYQTLTGQADPLGTVGASATTTTAAAAATTTTVAPTTTTAAS
ncbi:MAG TPA: hypothetical protein VHU85_15050 [Acidimicrobiales bacterium]|nr:hypothetical protein [Acidimicrobiales bacterium]